MPLDLPIIMEMSLVIENRKYSKNFNRKYIENTKGLTEGQKLPERP